MNMSDDEILLILEKRFIQNKNMHKDIKWDDVKKRITRGNSIFKIYGRNWWRT